MEELGKKLDQILDRLRLLEELILEKLEFEGLRAARALHSTFDGRGLRH